MSNAVEHYFRMMSGVSSLCARCRQEHLRTSCSREQVSFIESSLGGSNTNANVVDQEEQEPRYDDNELVDPDELDEETRDEILAVYQRRGYATPGGKGGARKGAGKGNRFTKRADTRPTPPRDNRDQPRAEKCINCNGNHATRDCPNPRVPKEDRTCFRCGKLGHIGANCPTNPTSAPGSKSNGPSAKVVTEGSMVVTNANGSRTPRVLMVHPCECEVGWTCSNCVKRPRPRTLLLGELPVRAKLVSQTAAKQAKN